MGIPVAAPERSALTNLFRFSQLVDPRDGLLLLHDLRARRSPLYGTVPLDVVDATQWALDTIYKILTKENHPIGDPLLALGVGNLSQGDKFVLVRI